MVDAQRPAGLLGERRGGSQDRSETGGGDKEELSAHCMSSHGLGMSSRGLAAERHLEGQLAEPRFFVAPR
jgi:hypothetical protein